MKTKVELRTFSRREMLKLTGLAAAGAALAACQPTPPATEPTEATEPPAVEPTEPPIEALSMSLEVDPNTGLLDVVLPTGPLEWFEPKLSNPDEKVELTVWWGNEWETSLNFNHALMERFSVAYPNVTINAVGAQNCDAFVTAAAAGTPPDVFGEWGCLRQGTFAKRNIIIPLDEYIELDDYPLDDFLPGLMEANVMDGKIWGMIDGGGVFLPWTRPSHFTEIGKELTDIPADTDELWQWGKELTTRDSAGDIQRLGVGLPSWLWPQLAWLVNFGGELWDMEKGVPTPDHPGVLEALNDLVAQVEYYGVDTLDRWTSGIGAQGGPQNPWLTDNLTFMIEGDWQGQNVFDYQPEWEYGKDYGVIDVPQPPKSKLHGESALALWTWSWLIPSGTEYPDLSWELVRFLVSGDWVLPAYAKFKEIVPHVSMLDSDLLWWPYYEPVNEIFKSGRKLSIVLPMSPVTSEYFNLVGEAVDRVLHLTETPEEAMARVKDEVLAALSESE